MPKITQFDSHKIIFVLQQEPLVKNLAYPSMVCSVSFKNVWKRVKCRTKEEMAGLSTADEQCQSFVLKKWEGRKSNKDQTQDLRDVSGPSADPFTIH